MSEIERQASPWTGNHGRALTVAFGAGASLAIWSWTTARGATAAPDQVPQLVAAMAGCAVVLMGAVVWIGLGRHTLGRRRREVVDRLAAELSMAETGSPVDAAPREESVALAGSRRYHRPSCILVARKPVVAGGVEAGRVPCEMCEP